MDKKIATWITKDRKFKEKTMVQEHGKIAAERRALENEADGQIRFLTSTRDRARRILREQAFSIDAVIQDVREGQLHLSEVEVLDRVDDPANRIQAARRALHARFTRGPPEPTWREVAAKTSLQRCMINNISVGTIPIVYDVAASALSPEHERRYMRFLKEGPRHGDGCFAAATLHHGARLMQAALPRTYQHRVISKLWDHS
jgi:hypothetical protein